MGKVDQFLDNLEDQGDVSGRDEAFTVNHLAALEKFGQFSLALPSDFLLKFVQAANLNATSFCLEQSGMTTKVTLDGWDPAASITDLQRALLGLNFQLGEGPLDYLFVGLISLSKECPDSVSVTLYKRQSSTKESFLLSGALELKSENLTVALDEDRLEIEWPTTRSFSFKKLQHTLGERCAFSKVPITCGSKLITGHFPVAENVLEHNHFPKRQTVGWYHAPGSSKLPNFDGGDLTPTVTDSSNERFASIRLVTSMTHETIIYLVKHGVLLEPEWVDFQLPGTLAVVEADDLRVDLTGFKVVDDKKTENLQTEIGKRCLKLVTSALETPYPLEPTSSIAPPEPPYVTGSIALVVSIFLLVKFILIPLGVDENWGAPIIVLVSIAWIWIGVEYAARNPATKRAQKKQQKESLKYYFEYIERYVRKSKELLESEKKKTKNLNKKNG